MSLFATILALLAIVGLFSVSVWASVNALIEFGRIPNFERACAFLIPFMFVFLWTSVLLYVFNVA